MGSSNYFLWALQLWVGRRKESILGYVPKKDENKNSGSEGLNRHVYIIFVGYTLSVLLSWIFYW